MIRFLTAGESHGKALLGILEGIPAGVSISEEEINKELTRRQKGFGRGKRMEIEKDKVEVISGLRYGKTLGFSIGLLIKNLDWENWKEIMSLEEPEKKVKELTLPRPGHADLAGCLKYGFTDIRNVLERASARETAMRVAVGAICKWFLSKFKINFYSRVVQIGNIRDEKEWSPEIDYQIIEKSPLRCLDKEKEKEMRKLIMEAQKNGDTLGGIFEIRVTGLPVGLGTYIQSDKRLDGRLSSALMAIPGVKGVEIGEAFKNSALFGSEVQDEIFYRKGKGQWPLSGFYRRTNRAGGIEAGMTNGEELILQAAMKPISTLGHPLKTVDIKTKKEGKAIKERADVCVLPSASIIGEGVVAIEIASSFLEKFGGDSIKETKTNFNNYCNSL